MKRMSEGQRNAQRRRAGQIGRRGRKLDTPHASDCASWSAEPCNCVMRHDPDALYDRFKDRQLEGK